METEPMVTSGTRELYNRLSMLSDDIRVLDIADTEEDDEMVRKAIANIIKESLKIANLGYTIQESIESEGGE